MVIKKTRFQMQKYNKSRKEGVKKPSTFIHFKGGAIEGKAGMA